MVAVCSLEEMLIQSGYALPLTITNIISRGCFACVESKKASLNTTEVTPNLPTLRCASVECLA